MKTYVIYAIFNGHFQVFSTWLLHKYMYINSLSIIRFIEIFFLHK